MHKDPRLAPFHFGSNVMQVEWSDDISIFRMRDDTGGGEMTLYHVFPGIMLMYNDFHMAGCLSEFCSDVPVLGIDHCREGRIEWEQPGGSFLYLQEGDLQIDPRLGHRGSFGFPLCHYHGITIAVNIEEARHTLRDLLPQFGIDVEALYQQFSADKTAYIKRADESIAHIFSELYYARRERLIYCFRMKVLELLYYLHQLDPTKKESRMYFSKRQVDIVKDIARLLTSNLDKRYTIEALSERFDIPTTTLKLCFKGVFGAPIGQYLREYRMNEAARMLKNSSESVSAIAGRLGYDNQSKFAAAFKAVRGQSPKAYSKISVQSD